MIYAMHSIAEKQSVNSIGHRSNLSKKDFGRRSHIISGNRRAIRKTDLVGSIFLLRFPCDTKNLKTEVSGQKPSCPRVNDPVETVEHASDNSRRFPIHL